MIWNIRIWRSRELARWENSGHVCIAREREVEPEEKEGDPFTLLYFNLGSWDGVSELWPKKVEIFGKAIGTLPFESEADGIGIRWKVGVVVRTNTQSFIWLYLLSMWGGVLVPSFNGLIIFNAQQPLFTPNFLKKWFLFTRLSIWPDLGMSHLCSCPSPFTI